MCHRGCRISRFIAFLKTKAVITGHSTSCVTTSKYVTNRRLIPTYICWPDNNKLADIENAFHRRSGGFPGVIGAVDGCHIEIKQPAGNANDYYNRKGTHSIILQGTCDHTGKFIDVLIGAPGRAHDARILRHSSLYRRLTNTQHPLLPPDKHLLGDSGYPLLLNLLTPFRDNGLLSAANINYNIKHASIRSVIERAFGRLKGKFRLFYLDVKSVPMATSIVGASCMLYNFILIHDGVRRDSDLSNRNSSSSFDDEDEMDEDSDDEDDDDNVINLNAIQKRLQIMESLG
ncbi:putative nuclease HARBI1 [Chelonus insularis]|uniref:putative nuclease HARBI1 n=1 Tax=Chelonus insularis TaxID=460826 RepID=UPI00158F3651|nr:putative nuclease HARBI1 [Chelonus insularis]